MVNDSFVSSQIEILMQEIDALLRAQEYPSALGLLNDAWPQIRTHMDERIAVITARALIFSGFWEQAGKLLGEQLLLNPKNEDVLRWWVQAAAEQRNDTIIKSRGEVAVAAPVPISTVEHLSDCLMRTEGYDRANGLLKRNVKRLQVRGHRLRMHYEFYVANDPQKVIQCINKMPDKVANRTEFISHLALSHAALGNHEKALTVLSPLFENGEANASMTRYEILRLLGKKEEALESVNKSLESHGYAPLSKSWMDSNFDLRELRCDELTPSRDPRKVTIIMTAHRWNEMMPTSVRSMLEQTHQNIELLIIDDASPEVDVKSYQNFLKDDRVRIITQEINSGTYVGRNKGISEATGDFITFMDSDDWCHPQKIEMAIKRLDKSEDAVITIESYVRLNPVGKLATVGSWFVRKCLMSTFFKASALKDIMGGFDTVRVSADSEFIERMENLLSKTSIIHLPAPVYIATHLDTSLTGGGQFAIGWKGISGPRAEYVANFRSWHRRMIATNKTLYLDPNLIEGKFPVPIEMPRNETKHLIKKMEYPQFSNFLDDIESISVNPFAPAVSIPDKSSNDKKISICMATFPARFDVISKAVESLLNQSIAPDQILIHVNESAEPPKLPNDSRIIVHCSPTENLTDIGKFKMCSLVDEGLILTVDDDIIYPFNYVESMANSVHKYGGKAIIGVHGAVIPIGPAIQNWEEYLSKRRVHWFQRGLSVDLPVQIVGTGTMAYDSDYIKLDWNNFDYDRMVDLHVAVEAQRNGYPMITPIRPDEWMYPIEQEILSDEVAIWDAVQSDELLQNKMIEVLNRISSWALHLVDSDSITIDKLKIAQLAKPKQIVDSKQNNVGKKYNISSRWRQDGTKLFFDTGGKEVYFEMPKGWSIDSTHEDLFRVAHYVLMSPWEKDVLEDWVPSRKPGWRPGLAFSGGMDSVAAMLLMPQDTVLIYNRREGFKTILDHTNAEHLIQYLEEEYGRTVVVVPSSHESIRTQHGFSSGFSTDYACGVQVILLADYFGLDSIGTGMPLENTYLFHGHKYRDFELSWFWRHHSDMFSKIGLDIYQPVAGCSEIINMRIVQSNNLEQHAQSCLRSNTPGVPCGACWKCFRKNSLLGHPLKMSNEIVTFLKKRPLKQAASTLYSMQRNESLSKVIGSHEGIPNMDELLGIPLDFLEYHYEPALSLLPLRYRRYTRTRLQHFAKPMEIEMIEQIQSLNMFESLD